MAGPTATSALFRDGRTHSAVEVVGLALDVTTAPAVLQAALHHRWASGQRGAPRATSGIFGSGVHHLAVAVGTLNAAAPETIEYNEVSDQHYRQPIHVLSRPNR